MSADDKSTDAAPNAKSAQGEALTGTVLPPEDVAPAKPGRRKRSGTSGAERKRRAKAASTSGDKAPRTRTTVRRAPIAGRMAGLYTTVGVGLTMAGGTTGSDVLRAAGEQTVATADECGKAWETLAKENPRVRDALERMLTVTAFGALLTAHAPIMLAVAASSGKLPAGFGQAPPDAPPA